MIIFIPLGIIASIFQLAILREFSFSIAKNELSFVAAAGFWIIFCSLGSIVKTFKRPRTALLCILTSLIFSLSICLVHLAKSLAGLKYYEAANLSLVLFFSIILIGPTAFTIGLAFRHFVREYIRENPPQKDIYAKFFAFEAIGFFLGGMAFTFCFIDYTNPLIFALSPLILLPAIKNHYKKIFPALLIIIITITSAISFNSILRKEFAGANILVNLGSSYGPVITTYKAGATTLFSGGSSLATSEDKSANEEFIHMSLSAAGPSVDKDILFIGAAISGQAEEIAKYKLNSLDCLQINPLISKLAENTLPAGLKSKVNFISDDPRLYLKNANKQYDAILMSMPAPINLALNRYFTEDFFKLIPGRLKPKGVFAFTIPSKREVLSPQFARFDSSIINALDRVFGNKFIIPSDSMIVIASGGQKINADDLLNNFAKVNPRTKFFTIYHFKDYLEPAMRGYTESMLDKNTPANTGLNPSGFLNYLILEQIKFYPNLKIDFKKTRSGITAALLLLAALVIILGYFSKKSSCLLNIGMIGFTSISFSSIIFVLFQLYCGALFWKLGLLIALFMAGLSAGTFLLNTINPSTTLRISGERVRQRRTSRTIKTYQANLLSGVYLFWMISIFILFSNLEIIGKTGYAELIFYLYALICGFLTGSSYPLLARNLLENKFSGKNLAMTIYSADLIGAFLGTIVSGILLIPFLGIPYSLLTLILLNAIFALKNLRG